jgi:hypothetical protein
VHITGLNSNDGERNKLGGIAPFKHTNDTEPAEPAEGDLDIKDTSIKNASRKAALWRASGQLPSFLWPH